MNRERINNYIYVLAVSKRARELLKGNSKPLVPYKEKEYNAIKIAKEEIEKGLVIPIVPRDVIEQIDSEETEKEKE